MKPTLSLEQASNQTDPILINNTVKFTAVFSEPITVSSFACEDITLSGSASSSCNSITQTGVLDGTTFDIDLTATTAGTLIASVPDAAVHDIV